MSATNLLEEFLHAAFNLPVVKDLGQTKIERVISYQVTNNKLLARTESTITMQPSVSVSLRAENGYDSMGWLHSKLAGAHSSRECELVFTGPNESVEYISPTEVIYTVTVMFKCVLPMDAKKELIKSINVGSL